MSETGPLSIALLREIEGEFPAFRLVFKCDSSLSLCIDWTLRLLTLGQQRSYRSRYHTVIGSTLYLCPDWHRMSDIERVILLRHERVHLRQRRRYSFPVFAFAYLFVWLPLGLSWARARLEWEAYTETLRATFELLGPERARSPYLREEVVRRFTGPDYGWMWPFPASVQRWYDRALEEIEQDTLPSAPPEAPPSTHPQPRDPS